MLKINQVKLHRLNITGALDKKPAVNTVKRYRTYSNDEMMQMPSTRIWKEIKSIAEKFIGSLAK